MTPSPELEKARELLYKLLGHCGACEPDESCERCRPLEKKIASALSTHAEEREQVVIKEIMDGTRKVFGDGTKGPWKMLLDTAKEEARKKAIEEAAKVAEDSVATHKYPQGTLRECLMTPHEIATAIRNLKTTNVSGKEMV